MANDPLVGPAETFDRTPFILLRRYGRQALHGLVQKASCVIKANGFLYLVLFLLPNPEDRISNSPSELCGDAIPIFRFSQVDVNSTPVFLRFYANYMT